MGLKNLFVFTALLLVWKVCRVYGQPTCVEYINQPFTSSVATTIQPSPHLVVPATYTPGLSPYDCYIQESVPVVPSYNGFNGYSNYAPCYQPPLPPIIIENDASDNFNQILYFLLFAMRNKRNCGSGNFGGCSCGCNGGCCCGRGCNCGCGGCGNCGGGYDNNGFCGYENCVGNSNNNFGSGYSYIPFPFSYPMNCPYPFSFPGFGYPDNSCSCIEETNQQKSNDIILHIITDQTG